MRHSFPQCGGRARCGLCLAQSLHHPSEETEPGGMETGLRSLDPAQLQKIALWPTRVAFTGPGVGGKSQKFQAACGAGGPAAAALVRAG